MQQQNRFAIVQIADKHGIPQVLKFDAKTGATWVLTDLREWVKIK